MGRRTFIADIARSRVAVLLATALYAAALMHSHADYLNPVWEYFGFTFEAPAAVEMLIIALLLGPPAALLPSSLTRPSSVIVVLLFVVVYVPTVVITLCLEADPIPHYGQSLIALGVGFSLVCLGARTQGAAPSPGAHGRLPGASFSIWMFMLWFACCVILVYSYRSIMALPGFIEIYDQRAAGRSTNLLMGYVQTYFSNVFSPALIAFGLVTSRRLLVVLGAAGCFIMFMIAAQRTVVLLPLAMLAVYVALSNKSGALRTSSALMALLAISVFVCTLYYEDGVVMSLVATMLVFRTLALPGLTFSQYHDLFSNDGFTWWSHIKGLNALIPTPQSYVTDAAWPNLGYVVGDRLYGEIEHNVNANLFSGDGVAAAGAVGVVTIAIIFAIWLAWLDRASRGWDRTYAILVIVPVALSLTNGHFFTTLLSFGGLFWMLVFYACRPGRAPKAPRVVAA